MRMGIVATRVSRSDAEQQRIDRLGTALRRYQSKPARRGAPYAVPMGHDDMLTIPCRLDRSLVEVTVNPILYALKMEAREIGWALYNKGGTDALRSAAGRIDQKLANFLDTSWIGIGAWSGTPPEIRMSRAA